jgi:hypothetical protein
MGERKLTVNKRGGLRCTGLFFSLVAVSFFHPFSAVLDWLFPFFSDLLGTLLYTSVLVASVHALSTTKKHVVVAILLAVPALVLSWLSGFFGLLEIRIAYLSFFLLFIGFTVVRVLSYVLNGKDVVADKIFGGLSVYLLFGHGWAFIFIILEALRPGSFAGLAQPGAAEGMGSELIYYSFVTLTTLGYGEITPVSITARNLAAMEAVTGVLYLATLVARLVGLYRSEAEGGS